MAGAVCSHALALVYDRASDQDFVIWNAKADTSVLSVRCDGALLKCMNRLYCYECEAIHIAAYRGTSTLSNLWVVGDLDICWAVYHGSRGRTGHT